MKTGAVSVLAAVLIFLLSAPAFSGAKLVLGIHPYLPADEIMKKFTPLAEYISQKTGSEVEVRISRDFAEHVAKVGENEYDIAYMGPATYVEVADKFGRRPVLGRMEVKGSPTFRGYIAVSETSGIKTMADLKGRSIAFADRLSTMGHVVPMHMLLKAGISVNDLSKFQFMSNQDNAALGVLVGEFDAAAMKPEVFDKYRPRGLRALALTPDISELVFVARSDMKPEDAKKFSGLLQGLKDTEEGRKILAGMHNNATAIAPAEDADYENLRVILRELSEAGVQY